MPTLEPGRGTRSHEDRVDCSGSARHRLSDRKADNDAGSVSAVVECAGECLKSEEKPRSCDGFRWRDRAKNPGQPLEEALRDGEVGIRQPRAEVSASLLQ